MKYDWLDAYLLQKTGAVRDFKIEWQWERYLISGKMFAATCTPDPKYKPHNGRKMVILKCDPLAAEMFRKEYPDVVPGFYCDKRCWNTIYLDGEVPNEVLKSMCDMSYQLVFEKLPKKVQKEVLGK
ncbi:MAG: MmcQ/YjbR family DNA-binding protein [Clostridiales bacterium]|nr:MmcQ/YjbR family DNA-binding protein [Clostridiales bacterium]